MNLKGLEDSLIRIAKELDAIQGKRETLLQETRGIIAISAKAIVAIHTGKLRDAASSLREARKRLNGLRRIATPDLERYLIPAEAEFVEASIVYSLSSGSHPPTPQRLRVGGGPYLLGLLDALGELKRMIYDRIREGKSQNAAHLFEVAERLYLLLTPLTIYDHVVPGVKRKLDVARGVIESTRAAVTEETRRVVIIRKMQQFQRALS